VAEGDDVAIGDDVPIAAAILVGFCPCGEPHPQIPSANRRPESVNRSGKAHFREVRINKSLAEFARTSSKIPVRRSV
jgi:hypothetical protein